MPEHLVGRETELAAIGKTTLWREGCRRAEARGMTVLACRPAASETRLALAGLGDLLGTVSDAVFDGLPEPQRRVLDVALLRADPEGAPPDRRTVSFAFLSVVRALAASGPVLLAVDDAQWLDAPTAAALEFAARRLDGDPVGILIAVRLTAEPATTFDRGAVQAHRAVAVGPLTVGALHELLNLHLGHSFLRPTLLKIEQAAAGNPRASTKAEERSAIDTGRMPVERRLGRVAPALGILGLVFGAWYAAGALA